MRKGGKRILKNRLIGGEILVYPICKRIVVLLSMILFLGSIYFTGMAEAEGASKTRVTLLWVTLGSKGTENGQYQYPDSVAFTASGNVYVADFVNHSIHKFQADGTWVTSWGGERTETGQFQSPYFVVVDTFGNIYIADKDNNRIEMFTTPNSQPLPPKEGNLINPNLLNPQPLPPKEGNLINPNLLNPQPLPPKEGNSINPNLLNPQPLPPKEGIIINPNLLNPQPLPPR
ncbi:hypothetical protein BRE01_44040 [Brevibacillus reuszeri]|uniref:6-bladed beta-propeller n=1 Tax=Brevibacillus reuszeri TaxID=54915 RepID=A0ABQ0TS21_9BACL|nr:hypothetical protein [Brevibacillus reuszeri]GED70702.1 hypothetical protein BRE01_44040 [Brevibacillus reuszeri]